MHEPVAHRKRKRLLSRENVGLFMMGVVTVALMIIVEYKGMPDKWLTAIFGTVVPFTVVVIGCHLMWRRWSLWAALAICLAIHSLAIWAFFQYALSDSQSIGFLLWFPISLVEIFVLFIAVKQIEDKLTGKKEPFVVN
jgi:hypothetical protein